MDQHSFRNAWRICENERKITQRKGLYTDAGESDLLSQSCGSLESVLWKVKKYD